MSRPGLLIVISGPGAVGKDTLIELLLRDDPLLIYSVSYTTRTRRDYEQDGEHYRFVDEAHFWRLVEDGELLEHARVNGYLYGTSATFVEEAGQAGKDVILKIDVQGAEQVRRRVPDGLFIFVAPPSMEELKRRRIERGSESPEIMEARQRIAEVEMGYASHYEHVVVNDDAERAAAEIREIVQRRRSGEPARSG